MFSGKDASSSYIIGVGRADITGPAADVNMMGYANPNQVSGGLHMRQYARAFLVQQGRNRILFVNVDACMGSLLVKLEVLKVLKQRYGSLYDAGNVCISGTHTHSAPAGFLQDVLFQITSMGYVPETLKAMVEGIVENKQSIHIAHESAAPGKILMNKGELLDSNINRSPLAYINNPEQERARYKYNVDKDMILLKFIDANGKGIGMINWFAVHCTSMNNTNSLISGDNKDKGYAELLFEEAMNPGSKPGEGSFVAAFAQSNEGDVSPNTRGPHCIDTGVPCDNVHSTCDGKVHNCIASGPGKDMFESTKIIGKNQFDKAMSLYKNAKSHVTGPVHAVHQYINMTNQTVTLNATHTATTCKPAMGFSFAAGTTDGPGVFDFKQGDTSGNGFWKIVRNFLHGPSKELSACHSPKPILLATGEMQYPYPWQPDVVDTQLFRIGQFLISAVPGEFTTMSGRRLSQAVQEVFTEAEPNVKFESVIAGLSNTYSDYIATYEEYHVQRYEGASTIYGPHTLEAYIQQYKRLSQHMIKDAPLGPGGEAHDIIDKLKSFVLPVIMDTTPFGYSMGDTIVDANDTYYQVNGDTVSVQFYSGNPRNSPTFNMTFLEVQRLVNQTWKVVLNDGAWDTRFIWERSSFMGNIRGISEATIKWDISLNTPPGKYRVHHYGHYKWALNHKIYPYTGHSKVFNVQ
uniref:Neutral ceramidase n=1 Tax=Ciona intestinalis TaxID=7719 RepID=F6UTT2_CIOIN